MTQKRHPKKEIEEAIQYAEKCGWGVIKARIHLTLGDDYFVKKKAKKDARFRYGLLHAIPKIMQDKFVEQ